MHMDVCAPKSCNSVDSPISMYAYCEAGTAAWAGLRVLVHTVRVFVLACAGALARERCRGTRRSRSTMRPTARWVHHHPRAPELVVLHALAPARPQSLPCHLLVGWGCPAPRAQARLVLCCPRHQWGFPPCPWLACVWMWMRPAWRHRRMWCVFAWSCVCVFGPVCVLGASPVYCLFVCPRCTQAYPHSHP